MSPWKWIEELYALSVFFAFLIFAYHFFFSFFSSSQPLISLKTLFQHLYSPLPHQCGVEFYVEFGSKVNKQGEKSHKVRNSLGKKKSLNSPLKYNIHDHFYARVRLKYHPIQPVYFSQHWNRLLFSQLNTWWSSWLTLGGHLVQKKKKMYL